MSTWQQQGETVRAKLATLDAPAQLRVMRAVMPARDAANTRPSRENAIGTVLTPDAVRAKMDETNQHIGALGADMERVGATITPELRAQWLQWRATWAKWYTETRASTWTLFWSASATYDTCEDYDRNLAQWRQKFIAGGGKPTGPAPIERPENPYLASVNKVTTTIIVVAAVVGGIFLFRELGK